VQLHSGRLIRYLSAAAPEPQPGDLVLIEAMGGGFTWGSALLRW